MIKSIWKFLTEDPSKPVSNPEPEVEKKPETKPETNESGYCAHNVTLYEKLLSLKNVKTNISSTTSTYFEVLHINKKYDGYGYDIYERSGYRTRSNDSYEAIVLISGNRFFRDIYPMIVSGELRPTIDYNSCGIMKVGEEDIETSIVKDVTLKLTLKEDIRLSPSNLCIDIRVDKISVRRSGIKTVDFQQIDINKRIRSVGSEEIIHLIGNMYSDIKVCIEENFKKEVEYAKEQIRINNTLKEFDDNINKDSVRDCFAYIIDELGSNKCNIELLGITDGRTLIKDMSNKYWRVSFDMDTKRLKGSEITQLKITDKSLNLLFEINESITKLNQLYNKCNINLNICDDGSFQVDIRPIIEIERLVLSNSEIDTTGDWDINHYPFS